VPRRTRNSWPCCLLHLEAIERAVRMSNEARLTLRMCFALAGGGGGGGGGGSGSCGSPPLGGIEADISSVAASAARVADGVIRYGRVCGGVKDGVVTSHRGLAAHVSLVAGLGTPEILAVDCVLPS